MMFSLAGQVEAGSMNGLWLTEDRRSHIWLGSCGETMCGKVARLLDRDGSDAPDTGDTLNPDAALRGKPLIGLEILKDLRPLNGTAELFGKAYNPEDGKTYDVTVAMDGEKLVVTGCVLSIFCMSETWSRVR